MQGDGRVPLVPGGHYGTCPQVGLHGSCLFHSCELAVNVLAGHGAGQARNKLVACMVASRYTCGTWWAGHDDSKTKHRFGSTCLGPCKHCTTHPKIGWFNCSGSQTCSFNRLSDRAAFAFLDRNPKQGRPMIVSLRYDMRPCVCSTLHPENVPNKVS